MVRMLTLSSVVNHADRNFPRISVVLFRLVYVLGIREVSEIYLASISTTPRTS